MFKCFKCICFKCILTLFTYLIMIIFLTLGVIMQLDINFGDIKAAFNNSNLPHDKKEQLLLGMLAVDILKRETQPQKPSRNKHCLSIINIYQYINKS